MKRVSVFGTAIVAMAVATSDAHAATCGQPVSGGTLPTATDARVILNDALALHDCDVCICDVDGSGEITATDARRALLRSVGVGEDLYCPLCDTAENRCGITGSENHIPCALVVAVVNPVGRLGALQFNIHGDSDGYGGIHCSSQIPHALMSFNDLGDGTLTVAMIDLEGFATPGPVVSCSFTTNGFARVTDFQLTLVDAADTATQTLVEQPILAITHLVGF